MPDGSLISECSDVVLFPVLKKILGVDEKWSYHATDCYVFTTTNCPFGIHFQYLEAWLVFTVMMLHTCTMFLLLYR